MQVPEDRGELEFERGPARKMIHIDMDAFYARQSGP
jgi:hypothetical protein